MTDNIFGVHLRLEYYSDHTAIIASNISNQSKLIKASLCKGRAVLFKTYTRLPHKNTINLNAYSDRPLCYTIQRAYYPKIRIAPVDSEVHLAFEDHEDPFLKDLKHQHQFPHWTFNQINCMNFGPFILLNCNTLRPRRPIIMHEHLSNDTCQIRLQSTSIFCLDENFSDDDFSVVLNDVKNGVHEIEPTSSRDIAIFHDFTYLH